jgi:probable rRNA maturation factor
MIKINVIIRNKVWKKYLNNPTIYLNKKNKILSQKINFLKKNKFNFSLMLANGNEIKILNSKFRKKNKTTDVLSFPFYTRKKLENLIKKKHSTIYLGDVIVNLGKIKNKSNKKLFKINFDKLWIHGLLHLFGHRHKLNKDYFSMLKLEKLLLNTVN